MASASEQPDDLPGALARALEVVRASGGRRCSTSWWPRPDRSCAPPNVCSPVVSKPFFLVTALALFVLAAGLVAVAVRDVCVGAPRAALPARSCACFGLHTIAVAVFEVAKFLVEEELIANASCARSPMFACRSPSSSRSSSSCYRWRALSSVRGQARPYRAARLPDGLDGRGDSGPGRPRPVSLADRSAAARRRAASRRGTYRPVGQPIGPTRASTRSAEPD